MPVILTWSQGSQAFRFDVETFLRLSTRATLQMGSGTKEAPKKKQILRC